MPRYCAVKLCRNRGGGTSSRQDNKRISFYPFPLQDNPRLQKWVDNMKREEWTPSRHQYLCSEHFTEDCFDIRWGIRYLKNTAVPTVFPSTEDDGDQKLTTIKTNPNAKPTTLDAEPEGLDSPFRKKSLILNRPTTNTVAMHTETEMTFEPALVPDTSISSHSKPSEIQTAAGEIPDDSGMRTAPGLAPSPCIEPHAEEQVDSVVTVLCCGKLGPFSDCEANAAATALHATLSQAFSLEIRDKPTGCFSEERGLDNGEHISIYEHSYCRPDTDKNHLWSKISSLYAKILELDHREESTVARIRALETEISLLKRDGAAFKEKQKALEDYISSRLC